MRDHPALRCAGRLSLGRLVAVSPGQLVWLRAASLSRMARWPRPSTFSRRSPGHLAATTGMRRGEVLGVRWEDVDLAAGRLAVRHTIVLVNGEPRLSEPKTRRSRRTIDLDRGTVRALVRWPEVQRREREAWGDA